MREPTKETPFGEEDRRSMRVEGTYPAHIIGLKSREWEGVKEVFNLTCRIADEARKIKVPKYVYNAEADRKRLQVLDDNQAQVFVDAGFMVGAEVEDDGSWFYEETTKDWMTNEVYADRMEAIGVEFPMKSFGKGKFKVEKPLLQKIDADDVLGLPVMIEYGWKKHKLREKNEDTGEWSNKKDADGKQMYGESLKVIGYSPWVDGEKIEIQDGDEEAPF